MDREREHPSIPARSPRTEWFLQARFGMFIHWGLYAIAAKDCWVRSLERLSVEDYRPYFDEFHPRHFDPKAWARAAAKAGMKYAVLTAKHHDGFCLFDSKLTAYKSTNTPARTDIVRQFLEAFRGEGLKVGLYYSLIDWHHEDYPAYGDRFHPMRDNEQYRRNPDNFHRYVAYMHGQIRELLTNYGRLDIMWFDFSYDDMKAEKWKAAELMRMIRSLQPHVIIDNRLEGSGEEGGSIFTNNPSPCAGDFASPEQMIPPDALTDEEGRPIPWESCNTMNNSWGFTATDTLYKSPKTVIRMLVECVSKNGNLLLNVGPNANGEIPRPSLDILEAVGEWLRLNGGSIYGCGKSDWPKPEWGRFTQNGKRLYAHILEQNVGPIPLAGMAGKIGKARLLSDGSEVPVSRPWNVAAYPEYAFMNFAAPASSTVPLPDERDTVVELELTEADDAGRVTSS